LDKRPDAQPAGLGWYFAVLKKYAEFGGRAQRAEFWFFQLFNFIVSVGLGVLDGIFFTTEVLSEGLGPIALIYLIGVFLPTLGVSVRRLHDTGRSGWWFLLYFIPIVGLIVFLVFNVQDSQSTANKFGPNPKSSR